MKIETVVHGTQKSSAVENRTYSVVDASKMHVFASAQKTIVYAAVHSLGSAKVAQIAEIADQKGLKSKTPTVASCRFHLAELVKMNLVEVK